MHSPPLLLIADDEPFNVDVLEQELEDLGYATASAFDGQEALEQVLAVNPDLLLLDINMPRLDGFGVLERLKANPSTRDLPVIVISAVSDIDSVARGIEMGAEDYLPKPFESTLLEARIRACLDRRRYREKEQETLAHVRLLTAAAVAIDQSRFSADALAPVLDGDEAMSGLARVFIQMAEEVHAREQRLRRQIEQLRRDALVEKREASRGLGAYVPADRRLALLRGVPIPAEEDGVGLFADLVGFSTLAANLAEALGRKRGAEELVRHLDEVFEAVIAAVHGHQGSVLGFSGDAVLCWFGARADIEGACPPPVARAASCAAALGDAMAPFADVELVTGQRVSLKLKVAVASGRVHRALVGDPAHRLVEVLAGAVIDQLAAGEQLAQPGEVLISEAVRRALGDQARLLGARRHAGAEGQPGATFYVADALPTLAHPQAWPAEELARLDDAQARPFVFDEVHAWHAANAGAHFTALRVATALFLRFEGIAFGEDPDAPAAVDRFLRWVQGVLASHGGYLIQVTFGDKGSYLYASFGAPRTNSDDAASALRAALTLRAGPEWEGPARVLGLGVARGEMRCGAYGGSARSTYGVIGDRTNLAARLMQAASRSVSFNGLPLVVCDEATRGAAADAIELRAVGRLKVKGEAEPVPVFAPVRERPLPSVDALSPAAQAVIRVASAWEGPLDPPLLMALLRACGGDLGLPSVDEAGFAALLEEAVVRGLLRREGATHTFAAPAIQASVHGSLLFADLRRIHRSLARFLQARGDADPAVLAAHLERAELWQETVEQLERAGGLARERGDREAAVALLERARALEAKAATLSEGYRRR